MSELERMSPDLMPLPSNVFLTHCNINEDEPRDLSIKRKLRPVPPPLDLSKRNLEPDQPTELTSPKSPLAQKNLPLRKRAHSWSSQPEILGFQLSHGVTQSVIRSTIDTGEINSNNPGSLTPAISSSSSLKFSGLPTPHTPQTPHPHSAIPVITSRFNFGESLGVPSNESSRLVYSSQGPLNLSTASVGTLPSSLLSPAPSHPSSSSLNSSREELEPDSMVADCQMVSPSQVSPQLPVGANPYRMTAGTSMDHSGEGINFKSGSPYITPGLNNSHQWPTSVWSIFLAGVRIHFFFGGGQNNRLGEVKISEDYLSEDLGQLERRHQTQYAPHGLHLLRIIYEDNSQYNGSTSSSQFCKLFFRPVGVQHEDIMVIAPPDHPFYVRGKGWCSLLVDQASERYNIPCQQLQEGDICLPPYHPETTHTPIPTVTPDLTDAMKRFDFSDEGYETNYQGTCSAPPSATFPLQQTHRSVFLSPPASPSKKSSKGISVTPHNIIGGPPVEGGVVGPKSRRPMNGFMLFAKHHRLKLIQNHPGKDNRAISVLLGTMWRNLPDEDRERFNTEARVQAEERKRIDPDCWKRKRSHSTS